jgi:EmrB/QacA subfamily drug resistance transporter
VVIAPRSTRSGAPVWALLLTSAASVVVALDSLAVTTALPAIAADLGTGLAGRQWVVNAYTLSFAAGIVPATALGGRFGRRRVFEAGMALFTAASLGCAVAPTAGWLVAARFVQGLGAATVTPLGLAVLTAAWPAERRGAVLGLWGGLGGVGVAAGPVLGAVLTQALDWHWIFWINLPLGLAVVALAPTRLAEGYGAVDPVDRRGVCLLTGVAGSLMWGLTARAPVALAVGCLLVPAFVAWERRAPYPLVPPGFFRAPGRAAAAATWVCMTATITAATFFVAQFFREAQGLPAPAAGVRLLPWTAAPLLVAPLAGALADRWGRRPVLVAGMLLQGVGLGWFALAAGAGYGALVGALLVAGLGISTAMPVAVGATLASVPPEDLAKASGAATTLQRLGGGLGLALTAAVFARTGHLGSPAAFTAGFRPALLTAAALSLLGALTALGTDRSGRGARRSLVA